MKLRTESLPFALLIGSLLAGCGSHTVAFNLPEGAADDSWPNCSGYPASTTNDTSAPRAWAVGSELTIQLAAYGGWGDCTATGKIPLPDCTDRTAPTNLQVTSSDPSVWQIVSGPDADNNVVVRAVGPGTGSITATADNAASNTLELTAAAPESVRAIWSPGYEANGEGSHTLSTLTLATGAQVSVTVQVLDARGEMLCVPATPGSVTAHGVNIASGAGALDPSAAPTANGQVLVTAGSNAMDATLDVTLGAWTGTVPARVVAPDSLTRMDVTVFGTYETGAYLRLHTWAGADEVLGGAVRLESLTPDTAVLIDPVTYRETTSITSQNPTEEVRRNCPDNGQGTAVCNGARASVRASLPGTSVAPLTVDFTFASM